MKLLITSPITHPENHELSYYLDSIYTGLKKAANVSVVVFGKVVENENKQDNQDFVVVNKKSKLLYRNTVFLLEVLKRTKEVDAILSLHALAAALPSLLSAAIYRKKFFIYFGSDEVYERFLYRYKNNISLERFYRRKNSNMYFKILFRIQKFVLQKSTNIIVPNNYFKKLIVKVYNLQDNQVTVIYPFSKRKIHIPFIDKKEEHTLMVYASLFEGSRAKIENIIKSLDELRHVLPDIKLHIFGDGEIKKDLILFANNLGVSSHVHFHGKVSEAEIYHYKQISKIFISHTPSIRNIYHLLQNFQTDCITVADTNELSTELINEKLGVLTDIHNVNTLKEDIKKILTDTLLQNIILKETQRALLTKHNVETYCDTLERVIKSKL